MKCLTTNTMGASWFSNMRNPGTQNGAYVAHIYLKGSTNTPFQELRDATSITFEGLITMFLAEPCSSPVKAG